MLKKLLKTILLLFTIGTLNGQTIWSVNTIDDTDDGACDASHCSLREAINAVNNNVGADVIDFNIQGTAPFIIQPNTPLPRMTDEATTVDGSTHPNYS